MNRRSFLTAIAGAIGALTLDPEKAIWTPGKKLISIPKPRLHVTTAQDIIETALRHIGTLQPFEPPCASEVNFALAELNAMLDSWNAPKVHDPRAPVTPWIHNHAEHRHAAIYGLASRLAPAYGLPAYPIGNPPGYGR